MYLLIEVSGFAQGEYSFLPSFILANALTTTCSIVNFESSQGHPYIKKYDAFKHTTIFFLSAVYNAPKRQPKRNNVF